MEDIKSLCERVLIDADHGYAGKVTLADAERLAKAVIVLSEALSKSKCDCLVCQPKYCQRLKALIKANEIARGEG